MPVKLATNLTPIKKNDEVARHLILISMGIALDGGGHFKIVAFENAATAVILADKDVSTVPNLKSLGGIGDSTAEVIREFCERGTSTRYTELASKHPMEALTMTVADGIGPKGAVKLYNEGIKNFDQLVTAAHEGKLSDKMRDAVLFAVQKVRVPHEEAKALAQALIEKLKAHTKLTRFEPAGSLRRRTADSKDIDIVACTDSQEDTDRALDYFTRTFGPDKVADQFISRGENRASIRYTHAGRTMQADLWVVPTESWGSALNYATGSKNHNVHLRMLAGKAGMTVNEYGIYKLDGDKAGERVGGEDEHDLYRLLGIPYVEPYERG